MTTGEKITAFLSGLNPELDLPNGIRMMNPFRDDPCLLNIAQEFYRKFYSDNNQRYLILGINPGRFGAGVTGITFTDTKRLKEKCGIESPLPQTHEPSSVFFYEMIDACGGVKKFYSGFIVSAVSPLGFTKINSKGKEINYNYYDSRDLLNAVKPFIVKSLRTHLSFGIHSDVCFCLGTGKNFLFLSQLNKEYRFFNEIVPLEHPRFIIQYRMKEKAHFIKKYLQAFEAVRKTR